MQKNHNHTTGIIFCLLAGFCWGSIGIFVKNISGITPVGIAGFRMLIAFVGLFLVILIKNHAGQLINSFKHWKLFVTLGFLQSLNMIFSMTGFHLTSIANATILNNTVPLFVPLLALFIGEKTSKTEWLGIIIGYIGIIFIFYQKNLSFQSSYFIGNFSSLAAALLFGIYIVINRRIRQHYHTLIILSWIFGCGGLFVLLESYLLNMPLITKPLIFDWYNLAGLAVIATLGGHSFFTSSLKYIKSSTASILILSSPVAALIYSFIFFSELPSFSTIIGLLIVCLGIIIVIKTKKSAIAPM